MYRRKKKFSYLSFHTRIGLTMTMPYFLASGERNLVEGPSSALSANSHHGCFSRVQKANGIAAL